MPIQEADRDQRGDLDDRAEDDPSDDEHRRRMA